MPTLVDELGLRDASPLPSAKPVTKASKSRGSAPRRSGGKKRGAGEINLDLPTPAKLARKDSSGASNPRKSKNTQTPKPTGPADNTVVVGIDFGCTYSAIASGVYGEPGSQVKLYQAWHRNPNRSKEKVPTRIAYAEENNTHDDRFGNDVKPGMKSTVWFKLCWGETIEVAQNNLSTLGRSIGAEVMRLPEGKDHMDVSTEWLRFLYTRIVDHYREALGEAFEDTPFQFYLTVPASWDPAVRGQLLQCAKVAGIGDKRRGREPYEVHILSEPEAVAVAALQSSKLEYVFKRYDRIMVLDLGGGTMDGSVHLVRQTDPLKLEEVCPQDAIQCGGTDIDRAFHALLKETFAEAFSDLRPELVSAGSVFMEAFEDIKCDFTGTDNDERVFGLPLIIPGLDRKDPAMKDKYDFRMQNVRITREQVKELFEIPLEKARWLMSRLYESIPTEDGERPELQICVLSGGLGSSPYIRQRMDEHVQRYFNGQVKLVQPDKPGPAPAIGAAMTGCGKGCFTSRKSQHFIGICTHERFDQNKHRQEDKFTCPLLGVRAKKQMQWHLARHEDIVPKMKKTILTYAAIVCSSAARGHWSISQRLYRCSEDDAPSRLNDAVTGIGTIKIDVSRIVERKRRQMQKEGMSYPFTIEIPIAIDVIVGSEKGVLEVQAKHNGRTLVSVSLEYEKEMEDSESEKEMEDSESE